MKQLVPYLIENGTTWVVAQEAHYRPLSRGLSKEEWSSLAPFFTAQTLEAVRLADTPVIDNPPFYQALAAQGIQAPLDFRQMSGITFNETVLIASHVVCPQLQQNGSKRWIALLFHECVHVCQYRRLGVAAFIDKYIKGWAANGFVYRSIPFEAEAYALQARFEAGGTPFSAEEAVARVSAGA